MLLLQWESGCDNELRGGNPGLYVWQIWSKSLLGMLKLYGELWDGIVASVHLSMHIN